MSLKIRICGLHLSVEESAVHEMLNKLKVKLTSKILYEKIRHPITNKMDSQRTATYFNAQTVGKQVIQNQYVRTTLAAKYIKSLVIYRDRKNVHTMKSCKHIAPFSGSQDVLSNFYPCELHIYGVKHKSGEHAFQFTKAIRWLW